MATVRYSSDKDETILEEAADPETGALRVRLQPQIANRKGQYVSWPGVSWVIRCDDVDEAERLIEGLRVFLRQFSTN